MGKEIKLTALILMALLSKLAYAESVHVAVAANFTAPMKDIAARFEQKTNHQLILSFGSSGKFFAQIQNGAPYQVFLSADQAKPEALEQAELTVPGSRVTYAIGALALWSSKADLVDEQYTALKDDNFRKLALANPKLAPYGVAAIEVLEALRLKKATESKWVMGENIAQTYQFAATGNADLGFIAVSQVMHEGRINEGSYWIIPTDLYNPIRQDGVILRRASSSEGAKALMEFLGTDEAKAIIHDYGYTTE